MQQFRMKWTDRKADMLTAFEQLLSTESLVDVTLVCGELKLKAHKVVLSACSPYFHSLFVDNPYEHLTVVILGVRSNVFEYIIDFMYKGKINVFCHQLDALLKTAEFLKVKGLTEMSGEDKDRAASTSPLQQNRSSPSRSTNIPVTQTQSDCQRKRFRSDSVNSDEEIGPTKIKEPESLESISDSIPVSSKHSNPVHSSAAVSHLSRKSQSSRSSLQTEDPPSECDLSVEPSKPMEQALTTNYVNDDIFVKLEITKSVTYPCDWKSIFQNNVWIEILEEFYSVRIIVKSQCELDISGDKSSVLTVAEAFEELRTKYHQCNEMLVERSLAKKLAAALTACKNVSIPLSTFTKIPNDVIKWLLSLLENSYKENFPVPDESESLDNSVLIIDPPEKNNHISVIVIDSDSDNGDNSEQSLECGCSENLSKKTKETCERKSERQKKGPSRWNRSAMRWRSNRQVRNKKRQSSVPKTR